MCTSPREQKGQRTTTTTTTTAKNVVSCTQCRKQHAKCDVNETNYPCSRCLTHGLMCDAPNMKSGGITGPFSSHTTPSIHQAMHFGRPVDIQAIGGDTATSITTAIASSSSIVNSIAGTTSSDCSTTSEVHVEDENPTVKHVCLPKMWHFLRCMERISARRKNPGVDKVVESLRQSLHQLALTNPDHMITFLTSGGSDGASTSTTSLHHHHYHHGSSPSDAIHDCLIDLFKPPFASFCLVVIDGVEMVYTNQAFDRYFFTAHHCNTRIQAQGQSPTQDILGSILKPIEMQLMHRILDQVLFQAAENPCERSQVLKCIALSLGGEEVIGDFRVKSYTSEKGEYHGLILAMQPLPIPTAVYQRIVWQRSGITFTRGDSSPTTADPFALGLFPSQYHSLPTSSQVMPQKRKPETSSTWRSRSDSSSSSSTRSSTSDSWSGSGSMPSRKMMRVDEGAATTKYYHYPFSSQASDTGSNGEAVPPVSWPPPQQGDYYYPCHQHNSSLSPFLPPKQPPPPPDNRPSSYYYYYHHCPSATLPSSTSPQPQTGAYHHSHHYPCPSSSQEREEEGLVIVDDLLSMWGTLPASIREGF